MVNFEQITFKTVFLYFSAISIFILLFCDNNLLSLLVFATGVAISAFKLFLMGNLTNVILLAKTNKILMSLIITFALIFVYGLIVFSFVLGVKLGTKYFVLFMIGIIQVNFAVFTNSILELFKLQNNLD